MGSCAKAQAAPTAAGETIAALLLEVQGRVADGRQPGELRSKQKPWKKKKENKKKKEKKKPKS